MPATVFGGADASALLREVFPQRQLFDESLNEGFEKVVRNWAEFRLRESGSRPGKPAPPRFKELVLRDLAILRRLARLSAPAKLVPQKAWSFTHDLKRGGAFFVLELEDEDSQRERGHGKRVGVVEFTPTRGGMMMKVLQGIKYLHPQDAEVWAREKLGRAWSAYLMERVVKALAPAMRKGFKFYYKEPTMPSQLTRNVSDWYFGGQRRRVRGERAWRFNPRKKLSGRALRAPRAKGPALPRTRLKG